MTKLTKRPKAEHQRDCWQAPRDLFHEIEVAIGGKFDIDVAADVRNTMVRKNYLTPEKDALAVNANWFQNDAVRLWLNPPYSEIYPWLNKAVKEMARGRKLYRTGLLPECPKLAVLLPYDASTKWWIDHMDYASQIWLFCGKRIQFVPHGVTKSTNTRCNCVWIFEGPRHPRGGPVLRFFHLQSLPQKKG